MKLLVKGGGLVELVAEFCAEETGRFVGSVSGESREGVIHEVR